jgi:FKBP-type peptidyl-prolyl cis-trans isomerase SlpA
VTAGKTVGPDSVVTLHYSLSLYEGEEVDSSRGGEPVTIRIGAGDWAGFLEQSLLGLTLGEKRHFEINAQDTAQLRQDSDVQRLRRTDFPPDLILEPGRVFAFSLPDGQEVAGQVLSIEGEEVAIDFSHPLAGRDLVLDVEILAID